MTTSDAGATAAPQWPPRRPQLLRDYDHARDFRRHAAQLARAGWHPAVVDLRPPSPVFRALNQLSLGLLAHLTGGGEAVHVTYTTR